MVFSAGSQNTVVVQDILGNLEMGSILTMHVGAVKGTMVALTRAKKMEKFTTQNVHQVSPLLGAASVVPTLLIVEHLALVANSIFPVPRILS